MSLKTVILLLILPPELLTTLEKRSFSILGLHIFSGFLFIRLKNVVCPPGPEFLKAFSIAPFFYSSLSTERTSPFPRHSSEFPFWISTRISFCSAHGIELQLENPVMHLYLKTDAGNELPCPFWMN